MSQYIFEQNRDEQELMRLRLIEQSLDEESTTLLKSTGLGPGWRCLEVGAGAGSIAKWMTVAVGPSGEVIAVDLKTTYLQQLAGPTCKVFGGDFQEVAIEGKFDLVHCRYMLIHNSHSTSLLKKLCALLKPYGFLVAEEPDFTSAKLLNTGADASQQRVNNAICRMFEEKDLDPAYGLGLPNKLAAEGLHILRVQSNMHVHRGGDAMARMMGESTRALADKYVATGEANRADIEKYIEHANHAPSWSVYYTTVSVIAAKTE